MKRTKGLWPQVTGFIPLCEAARRAAKSKAISPNAAAFLADLEPQAWALKRALEAGEYQPSPYATFTIDDPKPRTISAATFRDRVVHHSLCAAMAPTFERLAIEDSFACQPGKGTHSAVARAQAFSRRFAWCLKLDVARFFETANHQVLSTQLRRHFAERRLLELCDRFIFMGAPGSQPGEGLPIGNLTSQHFANLYLTPLDRFIKQGLQVRGYVRYMDDMLLFGPDKATLKGWRAAVEGFVTEHLHLRLRPQAERLGPVRNGVPFLGFRIWPQLIRLDGARSRRVRRRLKLLSRLPPHEANPRLESLLSWMAVADTTLLRRAIFQRCAWIEPGLSCRPRFSRLGES
ncbi:reverse transcriptase/maturase family protein [Myxococcota bacterium]|nr:reverse transcriptase/maturase family protein [Myxococcota bacterium]